MKRTCLENQKDVTDSVIYIVRPGATDFIANLCAQSYHAIVCTQS